SLPQEHQHVFTSARANQLSNMAMLQLLRGMRDGGYTVHGFRSAFSTWAREKTDYPREIVEACLAHASPYCVFIDGGTYPFTSYRAVSEAYCGTIACLGLGVSETPSCMVLNEAGRPVATVGYNGRIFRISEQGEIDYEHPLFEPIG